MELVNSEKMMMQMWSCLLNNYPEVIQENFNSQQISNLNFEKNKTEP